MSEEWKCPSCMQKDKELAKLKEDLDIQRNLAKQACFESTRAYAETDQWKKMFYDLLYNQSVVCTDPKVIIIGKDTDVLTDATDNNVGIIKE